MFCMSLIVIWCIFNKVNHTHNVVNSLTSFALCLLKQQNGTVCYLMSSVRTMVEECVCQ